MKKQINLLIALCAIVGFSSCFGDDDGFFSCEKGEGPTVLKEIGISDFTGIDLKCSANVILNQGDTQYVEVEGQDNIIDLLDTNIDGDTWNIEFDGCVRDYDDLTIYITIPNLEKVEVSGSGEVISESFLEGDYIAVDISGSGDIDLGLNYEEVDGKISGSGKFTLEGECDQLDYKISGSGNIRSFDLIAKEAKVKINGSGDVEVHVTDELDVNINGSGDVYYRGNPNLTIDIDGSGNVINDN